MPKNHTRTGKTTRFPTAVNRHLINPYKRQKEILVPN